MRVCLRFAAMLLAVAPSLFAQVKPSLVAGSADLSVTKSGPDAAARGANVTYTIGVTNAGPNPAINAKVTDALPAGTTFVSITQTSGPTFVCTDPGVGANGTVQCTLASMAVTTATFNLTVNIAVDGTVSNTATVSSDTSDPDGSNNSATADTTVAADLSIEKSGPSTAVAGANVAFTLTASNNGPSASSNVTVQDILPAAMTFVSLTQDSGPTFSCTTPAVGASGTISCTLATFANGATATFTLTAMVPSDAAPGTTYTNIAKISSSTTSDPNAENNQSTYGISTASNNADLSIIKTAPESSAANTDVPFSITVTNNGPATATNVSWSDTLPGTMTFVSIVQNSGPAFACSGTSTVTCSIASITASSTASFTLTAHIPSGTAAGTEFVNRATVTSNSDPTAENNSSVAGVTVSDVDMTVSKSGPGSVTAGQNATYLITVANNGTAPAADVQLSDPLPPNTSFVSFTQNNGAAATCSSTNPNVSCSWSFFAAGANAQFTLVVSVPTSVPGASTITNTATVAAGVYDRDLTNNSASTSANVIGVTDLRVSKSGPASGTAGSNVTYTITATNGGASTATNVQLTDTLPPNSTFISLTQTSGPAFACGAPSGGAVSCTLASFASGGSATFSLVVRANSNATSLTNNVSISSSTADTDGSNNSSAATTTLTASAISP